jgi:hypothetical protein
MSKPGNRETSLNVLSKVGRDEGEGETWPVIVN